MLPFEQLQKDIEAIQTRLLKEIDELIASGQSKQDIVKFIDGVDFDALLVEMGSEKAVLKYIYSLDEIVSSFKDQLSDKLLDNLEIIQQSQSDYVLGKLSNQAQLWKGTMLTSLTSEMNDKDVLKQLESIGLTDSQAGTVLQTSYYNFSRATTAIAYSDNPEQRFRYSGGVIPTSSKECEWLFKNQKKEGYTKAEIDAGIETPFGIINWNGRIPNYNCIHSFKAIL